ncbi:hypothetical protein A1OK_01870 [Enterovibrio norvegicus FF-454]|uniref:Uncharacterized protein n=1 Tax=Enterovibrio norvegicus FF-454 TaxID=1185651 RepID=A0A1E5C3I6_9GAMM|nr:hypothetical protein A1OK_01870 [Enterovibrio norvegicus FF-454]
MNMKYNTNMNIRTKFDVEITHRTSTGFIGRLPSVEHLKNNGEWVDVGSRWLINQSDIIDIMDNGFKPTEL